LNAEEARIVIDLRHKMTSELNTYAESLVAQYNRLLNNFMNLNKKSTCTSIGRSPATRSMSQIRIVDLC